MSSAMTKPGTKAVTGYGEVDMGAIEKEHKQLQGEREAAQRREGVFKLAIGKNVVRIMPPRQGEKSPFFRTYVHYLKNPKTPDRGGRPVVCPLKTRNAPCILCKRVSDMRRTGHELDQAASKELASGRRIFANVVNIAEPSKGVQIMEFGTMIYDKLLGILLGMKGDDGEYLIPPVNFTHPDTGHNVVIEKTVGNPANIKETTRYEMRLAPTPMPIPNKKWLGELHDLSKTIEPMDDDNIRAVLEGEADEGSPPSGGAPLAGGTAEDDLYDKPAGQ